MLLLMCPLPALGQTVSLGQRTPGAGLLLPPESAATASDASSGNINPAGIGLMRGLQLEYFHSHETESGGLTGDGLYGAATFFDVLAAGLSIEWLRPGESAAYHKTHWSLALSPDRTFSLGVAFNTFGSSDPLLDSLTSWDAGFTWRPLRFVSLSASALDFDNPALGTTGQHLPRRFDGALALRPFGPALTVAGDYLFFADGSAFGGTVQNGASNGRVGLTATLELAGFGVFAGVGLPVGQNQNTYGQLGLSIATAHLAALGSWAPALHGDSPLGTAAFDVGLRLSRESFPSIAAPGARVLNVDLAEALRGPSSGLLSIFSTSNADPYELLLNALDNAVADGGLSAVLLRVGDLGDLGLGRIEELRGAVAALRGRGKTVVALLEGGGDGSYYLAAACDKIFALPQTDFPLHGFASSSLYFAEGLAKLGVRVEVVRVGPYKSAPDALTRSEPSPEQIEVTRALLSGAMDRYLSAVEKGRGVSAAAFGSLLANGLVTAEELKAGHLIDDIVYPEDLHAELRAILHQPVRLENVDLSPEAAQRRWSDLPALAVVNVFGLITSGESQSGPLALARTAGANTITRALNDAGNDPNISAVIVRVDSGGGDGAASELIWKAMQTVRRRKPVVVSFGDVAASGGYYLAVASDEILAEPSTITGSIGVFAIKPDLSGLLGKLGVRPHLEASTPNADLFSLTSPWSESEKAVVQRYIDSFYATFVARVAQGRALLPAAVEGVGRGHVWSGAQAKERGLIDGYGSFLDAIEHAKTRAHLARDQQVDLITYGESKPLVNLGALAETLGTNGTQQLSDLARQALQASGAAPLLLLGASGLQSGTAMPLALPEALPVVR